MSSNTKSSNPSSKELTNAPTDRSRNSVIKGSSCFVWNKELVRPSQPYSNKNYKYVHNPPPNEVNFLEGIGTKIGRPRSKKFPSKSTTVQEIFNMRTSNRSFFNFTESPKKNNCLVRKKFSLKNKRFNKIVEGIVSADNHETPDVSEISEKPDCSDVLSQRTVDSSQSFGAGQQNDYVYYYNKDQIKGIVKKNLNEDFLLNKNENEEKSFREWALREREIFLNKTDSVSSNCTGAGGNTDRQSEREKTVKRRKKIQIKPKEIIKHLSGFLYGPFGKTKVTPDPMTRNETKLLIPNTMIERAEVDFNEKKIKHRILRRARLQHMNMPLPPSDDYISDENDSLEDVKTLGLIRTPYFRVPTIRTQQKKKKDRLRNRFLKKDRLNRITMLLYDRSIWKMNQKTESKSSSVKTNVVRPNNNKKVPVEVKSPLKEKYVKLIDEKFQKHRLNYENSIEKNVPEIEPITFEEFKKEELRTKNSTTKTVSPVLNSPDEVLKKFQKSPEKLFNRKKNQKLYRNEEYLGPYYIDPYFMDKLRNPGIKPPKKYYTSLIRERPGLRERLQVNVPKFKEEKLGDDSDKYQHRLATEWDQYYIHELKNKTQTRKFCVKSDIIHFREKTRNDFIKYYIQENLLDLLAKQAVERSRINNVLKFAEISESIFIKKQSEAYKKFTEVNKILKPLEEERKKMSDLKDGLTNKIDCLNENILLIEEKFDKLLRIQNYYNLLMDSEMRLKYDWIHRNKDGTLKIPLEAVKNCSTINIRPKTSRNGIEIKDFFDKNISPNLDKMKLLQPEMEVVENGITDLKMKAFTYLNEHNKTLWLHGSIVLKFDEIMNDFKNFFQYKDKFIGFKDKKLRFIEERNQLLKYEAGKLLKEPLAYCVKNHNTRKITAICGELYLKIIPEIPDELSCRNMTVLDKFGLIHEHAINLMKQLDTLSDNVLESSERQARTGRLKALQEANKALVRQTRFDLLKKQIRNFFPLANGIKKEKQF